MIKTNVKRRNKMKKSALVLGSIFFAQGFMAGNMAFAATPLTVTLDDAPVVECNDTGTGATVTEGYTIMTGKSSAATVTANINSTDYTLDTIPAGDIEDGGGWTVTNNIKTAGGDFSTFLDNGEYTLAVCADQPGNSGDVCSTASIAVNCTSLDPCANEGPFGSIVSNKNLCKANGTIQIHFKGNFDDTATLEIYNTATGWSKEVSVDKAGDSCNYHYNWDPASDALQALDGDKDTYIFTINGNELSFSADLYCEDGSIN